MGLHEKELQQKIKRIASGGCAMIIIGDVPVTKYTFFSPSLYHKKGFAHYKRLCEIAHSKGCKICAQLYQSDSNIKGMLRYIPGVLRKKISMEELRITACIYSFTRTGWSHQLSCGNSESFSTYRYHSSYKSSLFWTGRLFFEIL